MKKYFCKKCGQEEIRSSASRRIWCVSCRAEYDRERYKNQRDKLLRQSNEYRKRNRERENAKARVRYAALGPRGLLDLRLRSVHCMSLKDYESMVKQQGGVCAICKLPPKRTNSHTNRLHIDHDHKTGSVRGLLCDLCNVALGRFKDNKSNLRRAIIYLSRQERSVSRYA